AHTAAAPARSTRSPPSVKPEEEPRATRPPPTDIPRDPACRPPRGALELATARAPPPPATEAGRAPWRSATGPVLRPVALGRQALWGGQPGLPAQGPRGLGQPPPRALPRPAGDEQGVGGP